MQDMSAGARRTIRDLRLAKGLTQMQLAVAIGMEVGGVNRLENGRRLPSGQTLQKLATALGVDANEILIERAAVA